VEANAAALSQAMTLDSIDRSRILVCGHSEGAIVACALAAKTDKVTHVAALSGAGVTQLYSLMKLADRRAATNDTARAHSGSPSVLSMWSTILDDPTSIEKFWMGHPYNRWSSFLRHSQVEFLLQTDAKIFVAHGELDESSAVEGFDVMIATLLSKGKTIRSRRVPGVDHGFAAPDSEPGPPLGLQAILAEVVEWTLD
jgi:dipeptidyl aminopeptidase/acylaminoacyl peptidase